MSTSTALVKLDNIANLTDHTSKNILVKIPNNVIDIKNCIKIGTDADFRFKTIVKYRSDFYIIFKGSGQFPEEYTSKYFHEMDPKEFDDNGKLKRSSTIGEDTFTGFAMTEQTLDMYIRSLNGTTVESDSESSDSDEFCPCCRAYVWKVEVPNNIHSVKKLLRTALCHYSNNCFPIGVYYQDKSYYIMFKSNGIEPVACVGREGFKNFAFSNKDPDGERITRRRRYRFVMKHDEFWDYVEDLLDEYKKQHEKEGKDICE